MVQGIPIQQVQSVDQAQFLGGASAQHACFCMSFFTTNMPHPEFFFLACSRRYAAQDLDDAAADAGHDDTRFTEGADALAVAAGIILAAWLILILGLVCIIFGACTRADGKISKRVCVAVFVVCEVVAFELLVTSSQLNGDDWESATGCEAEVTWFGGLHCLIGSLVFLGALNLMYFFSPTLDVFKDEPNWFVRRALSLGLIAE